MIRSLIIAAAVIATNVVASAETPFLRIAQPVRLALPDFIATDPSETEMANSISQVVASDLQQSRAVDLVDPVAFFKKTVNIDTPPKFSDWRRTTTQELVVGRFARQSDRRIKVEFRLWDIPRGVQVAGKKYIGDLHDVQRIAHAISGEIYESITHQKTPFE
jgi:TolB protein